MGIKNFWNQCNKVIRGVARMEPRGFMKFIKDGQDFLLNKSPKLLEKVEIK
jgi:hypothetical protein